jgi:hypothetical protein
MAVIQKINVSVIVALDGQTWRHARSNARHALVGGFELLNFHDHPGASRTLGIRLSDSILLAVTMPQDAEAVLEATLHATCRNYRSCARKHVLMSNRKAGAGFCYIEGDGSMKICYAE